MRILRKWLAILSVLSYYAFLSMQLATLTRSLDKIGANPDHLTEVVDKLEEALHANQIKIDPETHSLRSEIHKHKEALEIEEVEAGKLVRSGLLKPKPGKVSSKDLEKALANNGFETRAPGKGSSHKTCYLPETDVQVTLVDGHDAQVYLLRTTAALVRAASRDRNLVRELHQVKVAA